MNDYKELPCRRCGRVWKKVTSQTYNVSYTTGDTNNE
jgi:hypothetical protein